MNSAIIVMTLLGCGQTDAACDYIRTVDTQFTSRAGCEARMDIELLKSSADGYPDVIAVCEPRQNAVAAIPGLPGPGLVEEGEIGEPKVVMAPPEAERPRPLKQMVGKTREVLGEIGGKLRLAWQKLVPPRDRKEKPLLLGEFRSTDN